MGVLVEAGDEPTHTSRGMADWRQVLSRAVSELVHPGVNVPNYFYKAVRDFHITGAGIGEPGIRFAGLDPCMRNAFGGATTTAAVATDRQHSPADAARVGQCLTGSISAAAGYAADWKLNRLLRITLPDQKLANLVKSAATLDQFGSMDDAIKATECTAIAVIHPKYIEYRTKNPDHPWAPINRYQSNLAEDDFSKMPELQLEEDADWA